MTEHFVLDINISSPLGGPLTSVKDAGLSEVVFACIGVVSIGKEHQALSSGCGDNRDWYFDCMCGCCEFEL